VGELSGGERAADSVSEARRMMTREQMKAEIRIAARPRKKFHFAH
jgi:hypothetical protein